MTGKKGGSNWKKGHLKMSAVNFEFIYIKRLWESIKLDCFVSIFKFYN